MHCYRKSKCELLSDCANKPTFREDLPHPEVAGGEPDDGGLVELAGDGGGQRQQLAQLEELGVLLLATVPRRVLALVLLGHRETAETASDISATMAMVSQVESV